MIFRDHAGSSSGSLIIHGLRTMAAPSSTKEDFMDGGADAVMASDFMDITEGAQIILI